MLLAPLKSLQAPVTVRFLIPQAWWDLRFRIPKELPGDARVAFLWSNTCEKESLRAMVLKQGSKYEPWEVLESSRFLGPV